MVNDLAYRVVCVCGTTVRAARGPFSVDNAVLLYDSREETRRVFIHC